MIGRQALRARRAMRVIAALMAACALPDSWAQAYPVKPMRMIVAVPPGGPADTLARMVGPRLSGASCDIFAP